MPSLVNAMDRFLDKTQDGVSARRETPWISTIRGPAARLEGLKVASKPNVSKPKPKVSKARNYSSDSENASFSSDDDESSLSDSSSSEDDRRGKRGKQSVPKVRSSGRKKVSDSDESSEDSPPRKWQPPKNRAPVQVLRKQVVDSEHSVSESESGSDFSSDYSEAAVSDQETDVEECIDLVVDKILAKRRTDTSWEYLVKWRGRSYIHCEWLPHSALQEDVGSDKRSVKLKNFNVKHHAGATQPSFEKGYFFNPLFETIEKILAVRRQGGALQYLVKWTSLPYGESTWEFRDGLQEQPFLQAIEEFESINRPDRCDPRLSTDSRKSTGRVIGRQFDPTVDFAHCLKAVRPKGMTDDSGPMEYEYTPAGKALVPNNEPPMRIFDFQKEGISWLLYNWSQGRGCMLADEMGLGKTVQTAVTLAQMQAHAAMHNGGELTVLIIAPLSTIEQWRREIKKWTNLEPVVYHGNRRDRNVIRKYEWNQVHVAESEQADEPELVYGKNRSMMPKFNVLITTFETVAMEPEFFAAPEFVWSAIVVDEAHKLKAAEGKARTSVLAIPCRHRVLLTGTPIQNNVAELWNLLHLCSPAVWDDVGEFLAEFGDLKSAELTQRLQNKIQPFLLQRRKADVLAHLMPAKEETIVSVELTKLQKETYRAVYEKNIALLAGTDANGKKTAPALTNVHMELRKCCNHPFLVGGVEERVTKDLSSDYSQLMEYLINSSGKMVFLDKLLEKLRRENSKILIFSQFTMMLDLIEDYLRWRGYVFERLDGAVKGQQRQEAVDRFNRASEAADEELGKSFVFLLSTKAGGVGLNLTAANYVLLFDHDWNPQNDLQAQARCHRIGQTKEVMIFRLVTRGTYEEKMFQVASQKLGLEQAVMSGGDSKTGGTKLTKEEMDRLLKEGAYAMLEDDENEKKFCSENVEEILQTRARTVSSFVAGAATGGGFAGAAGGFSKARFQVNETDTDVDVNDPEFWAKMASLGSLAAPAEKETEILDYSQRKGRAQSGQSGKRVEYSSLSSLDESVLDSDDDGEEFKPKRRGGPVLPGKAAAAAQARDKSDDGRLKRMKQLLRFVSAHGLVENRALFEIKFEKYNQPEFGSLEAIPAYADHLLLIASLYLMAKPLAASKFDEIHFCPVVRAAVGLLAQFSAGKESPPPSLEPLVLDSMLPDMLEAVDRLELTIPSSLVPQPLPRFVTEAVPRNRIPKKLILEIDAFNEIRYLVKNPSLIKRNLIDKQVPPQWTAEDDLDLLNLVLESGRDELAAAAIEKYNQRVFVIAADGSQQTFGSDPASGGWATSRIEKLIPKFTLVRACQLTFVVASYGFHPALFDKAVRATGYPWVRKFTCSESCMQILTLEPINDLLTPVTEIPTQFDWSDEAGFARYVLLQLPSDSPLSTIDVTDYAKTLLYRTISALGKKTEKHDASVKSVCKHTKTNEQFFEGVLSNTGVGCVYPIRGISRVEAFNFMWRFQTLHFLRSGALTDVPMPGAVSAFAAVATAAGLDRWDLVTNLNRHLKPTQCLQSLMKFVCSAMSDLDAVRSADLPVVKKRKSPNISDPDDQAPTKSMKLTDFFKSGDQKDEAKEEIVELEDLPSS